MKQTILYDEAYSFTVNNNETDFIVQFDYGTRYNQINMQFSHFHPYYEIYFLLNGTSQHFVEGQSFNLETYDMVLLKPFRLHRTNYFKNNPCKRLIFSFRLDFLEAMLPDVTGSIHQLFQNDQPIYRFNQSQTNQLIQLFNQLYKSSKKKSPTSNLLTIGLFAQLLDAIHSFSDSNEYFIENKISNEQNSLSIEDKIYEITSYIHQNYSSSLSLDGLAHQFYISPHYLSRQFKHITGFTLVQYIQETRIKRAQELLLDTDHKVIEIVEDCGFGSISQFNRVFQKLVGISPTTYRKNNRL